MFIAYSIICTTRPARHHNAITVDTSRLKCTRGYVQSFSNLLTIFFNLLPLLSDYEKGNRLIVGEDGVQIPENFSF